MKTKMILTMALLLLCPPLTTHSQELRGKIQRSVKVDEPGKLSHPRRMKVSSVNQLLGFDLSVG